MFVAVEARVDFVEKITSVAALILAIVGVVTTLYASWRFQKLTLLWQQVFVCTAAAALGVALGRGLLRAFFAFARPRWRKTLSRTLGATDSEIDDVFAMLLVAKRPR